MAKVVPERVCRKIGKKVPEGVHSSVGKILESADSNEEKNIPGSVCQNRGTNILEGVCGGILRRVYPGADNCLSGVARPKNSDGDYPEVA